MEASPRPRVLLLIPHLGGGGAERVTALLAARLSREKYEVHLGLMTQRDPGVAFDPEVTLHALGAPRVRAAAIRLLRLVRRLRPDLILSGMVHLNFLALLLRPLFPRQTCVVIRQNSTATAALEFGGLPSYTRSLYRLLYRRADRIVCQTKAMASDLAAAFRIPEAKLVVLPNPVDVEGIRARCQPRELSPGEEDACSPAPELLAMGRLSREKGFDLLLDAIARVRTQFPAVRLAIAGAGPEENALKALRRNLGLEEAVEFLGQVSDPWALFSKASAFVLSSRYEGLPNAMLEAAAAGLPIVAVPSSAGVAELLRGRPGVWLAEEISAEALAATLSEALRTLHPGRRFEHGFMAPFRLDRAIEAYEGLIDEVLQAGSR